MPFSSEVNAKIVFLSESPLLSERYFQHFSLVYAEKFGSIVLRKSESYNLSNLNTSYKGQ